MLRMKYICLTIFVFLLNSVELLAQCPMCRAAAEQNLKEGGTHGLGLNTGIFYLLLAPYTIIMVIALVTYYKWRKAKREAELEL